MRRLLRILKFAVLGIVALASIGLICLGVVNAQATAAIQKKVDELRAAGEPMSIAELEREPPAPEVNAVTFLAQAKEACSEIQNSVNEVEESDEGKKLRQELGTDEAFVNSEMMINAYRAALAAHPEVVGLLVQASNCPDFYLLLNYHPEHGSDFVDEMLSVIQEERAAMRVLGYRVRLLVSEGQREEAMKSCLAMLRLSRLFDRAPALVGQLVAVALRSAAIQATNQVLRSGPLTPAAHDQLDDELARQNVTEAYRNALRTERAMGMDHFADFRLMTGYLNLPRGKHDHESYLDLFQLMIANVERPYWGQKGKAEFDAAIERAGTLTKLLGPAIDAASVSEIRSEANLRCLRILNAVLRRPPQGEVKLADLGLPADWTIDPYTGGPLRLLQAEAGWVVYSVGIDLRDDGGKVSEFREDGYIDDGIGPVDSPDSKPSE